MTTCCPHCSSSAALGTEAASICTECATVSVAGAALSLPIMLTIAACAVAAVFAWKAVRRGWYQPCRVALR